MASHRKVKADFGQHHMNIAFDECGNTGQHLLDPDQWVFTLASTSLSDGEADQLLSAFAGRIQGEFKYSKLKRAKRNLPLILDLLKADIITSQTCKSYVIHKPFMTVSKLVDNVYEPLCQESGIDLYEGRAAQATANLISSTFPVLLGRPRYIRFLVLYSELCRSKTQDAFDRFQVEADNIYRYLSRKHAYAVGVFVSVVVACRRGLVFFAKHVSELDHDPIIPAYHTLANAWSRALGSRFTVLADDSKTLASERERLLKLSDPQLKHRTVKYYDLSHEYPLKIDDIICADSKSSSALQLADFLAGAAGQAFNTKAIHGSLTGFEQELMGILIAKELFIGGIWPGTDVTPKGLGATGAYKGNPADHMARLLADDPETTKV